MSTPNLPSIPGRTVSTYSTLILEENVQPVSVDLPPDDNLVEDLVEATRDINSLRNRRTPSTLEAPIFNQRFIRLSSNISYLVSNLFFNTNRLKLDYDDFV